MHFRCNCLCILIAQKNPLDQPMIYTKTCAAYPIFQIFQGKGGSRPKNSTAPGPRPPFWNTWIRHCKVPVVVLCTDLGDVDCRTKLIGSDPQNGWQALVLLQASFLFWGAFVRRRKYWAGFIWSSEQIHVDQCHLEISYMSRVTWSSLDGGDISSPHPPLCRSALLYI